MGGSETAYGSGYFMVDHGGGIGHSMDAFSIHINYICKFLNRYKKKLYYYSFYSDYILDFFSS